MITKNLFLFSLLGLSLPLAAEDLTGIDIEELGQLTVVSVSKKEQRTQEVASAVFVITQDDIRRSGVNTIPDALALAPGLDVVKINASRWAIGVRGLGGRFANKLLVLMDGRTLYSPSYSGVYWEVQDTNLNDIERIEIIRGPGGTIWGANAVNGVINIITKNSKDTTGVEANLAVGDYDRVVTDLQYGDEAKTHHHYRVFGTFRERDNTFLASGENANDSWNKYRVGGRYDWNNEQDKSFSLTGEYYNADFNSKTVFPTFTAPYSTYVATQSDVDGFFLNSIFDHAINSNTSYQLRVSYENMERQEILSNQKQHIADLDLTAHTGWHNHAFTFGGAVRFYHDHICNSAYITTIPERYEEYIWSGFIQDQITLSEAVTVTAGTKVEHNDRTGVEWQPSIRGIWQINDVSSIWGSIARAVRTPSRLERDIRLYSFTSAPSALLPAPTQIFINGSQTVRSETLNAYEMGVRYYPSKKMSLDLAVFYNDYDHITSIEQGLPVLSGTNFVLDSTFDNLQEATHKGFELVLDYTYSEQWRTQIVYSSVSENSNLKGGSAALSTPEKTPHHTVSFFNNFNIFPSLDLDVWLKYKSETIQRGLSPLTAAPVDSFIVADTRLAWRPIEPIELAFVVQNVFDSEHIEGIEEYFSKPTEHGRKYYINIKVKY